MALAGLVVPATAGTAFAVPVAAPAPAPVDGVAGAAGVTAAVGGVDGFVAEPLEVAGLESAVTLGFVIGAAVAEPFSAGTAKGASAAIF